MVPWKPAPVRVRVACGSSDHQWAGGSQSDRRTAAGHGRRERRPLGPTAQQGRAKRVRFKPQCCKFKFNGADRLDSDGPEFAVHSGEGTGHGVVRDLDLNLVRPDSALLSCNGGRCATVCAHGFMPMLGGVPWGCWCTALGRARQGAQHCGG